MQAKIFNETWHDNYKTVHKMCKQKISLNFVKYVCPAWYSVSSILDIFSTISKNLTILLPSKTLLILWVYVLFIKNNFCNNSVLSCIIWCTKNVHFVKDDFVNNGRFFLRILYNFFRKYIFWIVHQISVNLWLKLSHGKLEKKKLYDKCNQNCKQTWRNLFEMVNKW